MRTVATEGWRLLRREAALAVEESAVAARSTGRDGAVLLLGASLGALGGVLLIGAVLAAMALAMPLWLACLILAGALGTAGAAILLAVVPRVRRRARRPAPRLESILREDLEWIPTYLGRSRRSTDSAGS